MAEVGLTKFLLARIAEDEDRARYALKYAMDAPNLEQQWAWLHRYRPKGMKRPFSTSHHDGAPTPARVLAECDSKRRIVDTYLNGFNVTERTVQVLALPYADHPDYREEWRP